MSSHLLLSLIFTYREIQDLPEMMADQDQLERRDRVETLAVLVHLVSPDHQVHVEIVVYKEHLVTMEEMELMAQEALLVNSLMCIQSLLF